MKATVGAGHLSSVGAVRQAAELVETELGPRSVRRDHAAEAEAALDDAVPDAADVVDGGDSGPASEPAGPIEIEIPVDDAEETDDADDADDAA
jgi:hypothetical protein